MADNPQAHRTADSEARRKARRARTMAERAASRPVIERRSGTVLVLDHVRGVVTLTFASKLSSTHYETVRKHGFVCAGRNLYTRPYAVASVPLMRTLFVMLSEARRMELHARVQRYRHAGKELAR